MSHQRIAVVTGGSSGIGAAAVRRLASDGFRVFTGARRLDKLQQVTEPLGNATALELDVTNAGSIERFLDAAAIDQCHVLVNNAGGALGVESVEDAVEAKWRDMFETNVMGVLRMTRALLPRLRAAGDATVINVGSIAGFETYPGGAGYTASKHALRALTRTLRIELLGEPIRVTEVAPGLVETEFSVVRFSGDEERARGVYRGMQPLTADDIAECIGWVSSLPSHVNIDEIVVRPRDQATATAVHRRTDTSSST